MIDKLKKQQQISSLKITIASEEKGEDVVSVVFILNNDDIVYIGRTQAEPSVYVYERFKKYHSTHYYYEQVPLLDADNYLAELILNFQPMYNNRLPKNTQFISNNFAKEKYFIPKVEFRKVYKEFGGYQFGNQLFIEYKVFDDVFAISEPFHKNMPKVGVLINLRKDYLEYQLDLGYQDYNSYTTEDGSRVQEFITHSSNPEQQYKNIQMLQELSYEVVQHLNPTQFRAKDKDQKEIILSAEEQCDYHDSQGTWGNPLVEWHVENIKSKYLVYLEEKNKK